MFVYDRPIKTEKDDFLGRKKFSRHLGKALLDWKEKESLVIAIYGKWGSGKSSLINLAVENIEKSNRKNKPTIIGFNPWTFSEENTLSGHFFNEIAKELEIKNDTSKDKKIAKKLKFYASLLSLAPGENLLTSLSPKLLTILGLIGIGTGSKQVTNWFNIPSNWIQNALLIGGILLVFLSSFKEYWIKLANFFEKKAEYYSKSVSEVKREIKKRACRQAEKACGCN